MKLRHLFLLFPMVAMLAACGHDDPEQEKEKETNKAANKEIQKEDERLPICPQTAIVRELDEIRDYGRENPIDEQLVAKATMHSVDGTCEYRDTKKEHGINILFDLSMIAMRGPRLGGLRTTFPYFVAVVDPSGNVLNKNEMRADIHFSSNNEPANVEQSLHVFIPLDKKSWSTGPQYQVLMGWQLTQEQVDERLKAEGKDPIEPLGDDKPANANPTDTKSDSKSAESKPSDSTSADAPTPSVLRLTKPSESGTNGAATSGGFLKGPDTKPTTNQ